MKASQIIVKPIDLVRVKDQDYAIRRVEGRLIFSNEKCVDVFYFKPDEYFQNFPEQVSVRTYRSSCPIVQLYVDRLNMALITEFPLNWLERWIINLFKKLILDLGEENLMHPTMLNANNRFCEAGYKTYKSLYSGFFKGYPEAMPSLKPYRTEHLELHFMISANASHTFTKYFKPTTREKFESDLTTDELRFAYSEIYSESHEFYVEKCYKEDTASSNSDARLQKRIYLVLQNTQAVLCFATDFGPIRI